MTLNHGHVCAYLGLLLGGAVLYTLGLFVYRLFLHPLAKYPGPLLAKVTDGYQL